MNKKWLFLIVIAFVLSGCAVERLSNAISKGFDDVKTPAWDLDFDVPIGKVKAQLSKIEEVNNMLEDLKFTDDSSTSNGESALIHVKIDNLEIKSEDFNIDGNVKEAVGSDSVLTWPLPVGSVKTPKIDDTSIPVIKLDLDGDNVQDMMLTELKSTDGSLKIKMKMQFKNLVGEGWRDATADDYFNENGEPYIGIENITDASGDSYAIKVGSGKFSFKPGVYEDGKLVFETADFLTDYANPIIPEPIWAKDENGDYIYEDDGKTHKLSETDFEYRVSIPAEVFKIRGESFSIIENVLEQYADTESQNESRSRAVSRADAEWDADDIKAEIQSANGDVTVLENMLIDGVTLEQVAEAYNGDLNGVLSDSGVNVLDIMASDVIASDENIKTLGDKDSGFGEYKLFGNTTLEAIENAGNLKSLADFCKFYEKKAVGGIRFCFEVEVDLGESFMITAEFIKDYELAVDTGDSLPLSSIGNILERFSLEADVSHNFMCEMKIKEPKIADKTMKISGIKEADNGFYVIPEEPCRISFNLDDMPEEDGGLGFSLLIPKDKSVDIALNPTEETDLWIEMELGANGVMNLDFDEIGNMMGGE